MALAGNIIYRRSHLGNAVARPRRRSRSTVAVSARAGEEEVQHSLISPARLHALRVVPEHLAEDRLFEILRDGIVGRPLRDCCEWVGDLPCVNAWVEGHACDTMATLRFFVREAISVRAGRGTWRLVVGEHASHRHRGGRSANRRREVSHPLVARGPWRGAWLNVCEWVGFRGLRVGAALCRHEYGRHLDKWAASRDKVGREKRDGTGGPQARCVGRWRQAELGRNVSPFRLVRGHRCHGQTPTALETGRVDVG